MDLGFDIPYLYGIETKPDKMLEKLEGFDSEWEAVVDLAKKFTPRGSLPMVQDVVVLGDKPTVVAADILRTLLVYDFALPLVPLDCSSGQLVPAFVGENTLVFAISAGGADQVTVEYLDVCVSRGSYAIVVALEGDVTRYATENKIPCLNLPMEMLNFALDGYLFAPIAAILVKLGLMPSDVVPFEEATRIIKQLQGSLGQHSPNNKNQAKQLASKLYGKLSLIFSASGFTDGVAKRWANSIRLRTRQIAEWDALPSLHRGILTTVYTHIPCHAIFLRDSVEQDKVRRDFANLRTRVQEMGCDVTDIFAIGDSKIARLTSLLVTGDYTMAYLRQLQQAEDKAKLQGPSAGNSSQKR